MQILLFAYIKQYTAMKISAAAALSIGATSRAVGLKVSSGRQKDALLLLSGPTSAKAPGAGVVAKQTRSSREREP